MSQAASVIEELEQVLAAGSSDRRMEILRRVTDLYLAAAVTDILIQRGDTGGLYASCREIRARLFQIADMRPCGARRNRRSAGGKSGHAARYTAACTAKPHRQSGRDRARAPVGCSAARSPGGNPGHAGTNRFPQAVDADGSPNAPFLAGSQRGNGRRLISAAQRGAFHNVAR